MDQVKAALKEFIREKLEKEHAEEIRIAKQQLAEAEERRNREYQRREELLAMRRGKSDFLIPYPQS
jgi:lipoate-protein ligase A